MQKRPGLFVVVLALTFMCTCPASRSASTGSDAARGEDVRKADAAWAAAANTGNVDAWMAFYAPEAIVLLPNEGLLSGKDLARPAVTRLLGRSRLSVAWQPLKLETTAAGDLAAVIAAYELHFADSSARAAVDRGRRFEIWRRQADGTWRCTVDVWNSDEAAPLQSAPAIAPAAAATAPVPAPAQTASPAPPATNGPPLQTSKYGAKPVHYAEAIERYFKEHLTDPDSVQYREISAPEQGYVTGISGTFLMSETRTYGWVVKATINAKDTHGAYVGDRTHTFLFRGEEIAATRSPLPSGEIR